MITKLSEVVEMAKAKKKRRIAVAAAGDPDVLEALKNAENEGIIEPVLVGEKPRILEICKNIGLDCGKYEIIDIPDRFEASLMASQLIREGRAEILMKGMVSTGQLL